MDGTTGEGWEPRAICWRCERPQRVCVCAHIPQIETETPVLVLQHPRERHVAIGTARMASLCLPRSTLVVGTRVDDDKAVVAALSDPERPAILLWPGPGARDLATDPPGHPVTLVVVDGTWSLAKKLVRLNPKIAALPRYALAPEAPSEYRIRREPAEGCVSTIEAMAQALGILEKSAARFGAMMVPFRAMVDTQIEHQARLQGGRVRARERMRGKGPRPMDEAVADPARVVVVSGEANAWPYADRDKPPDELVHLTALRLGTGERFETFVAPDQPLCPSTVVHARVPEERIRGGLAHAAFLDAWRAFVREDDVLCAWNPYTIALLRARGAFLPERRFDVRIGAARWLGARPGGIEAICAKLGLEPEPLGQGRAGERLAKIAAVIEALRTPRPRPPRTSAAPVGRRPVIRPSAP